MKSTSTHSRRSLRVLCLLLLAALLALTCTACGDGGGSTASSGPWYKAEFSDLNTSVIGSNTSSGVTNPTRVGNYIYFSNYYFDEETQTSGYKLFRLPVEGGDPEQLELTMPETEPGWESNSWINSCFKDGSDNFYAVLNTGTYRYNTPAGWVESDSDPAWNYEYIEGEQIYEVLKYDAEGKLIGRYNLADALAEPMQKFKEESAANGYDFYFYLNYFACDAQGRLATCYDQTLFLLDTEGKLIKTLELDNWINGVFTAADGTVMIACYGDDGMYFSPVDFDGAKLGAEVKGPSNGWNFYPGSGSYDLYYQNGSSLYGYKLASGEGEFVLSWINIDVDPNYTNGLIVNEDGSFTTFLTEWDDDYTSSTTYMVDITEVKADPNKNKTQLTLATQYLDYDVQSAVISFNRRNPDIHINVVDYSQYNTDDDYEAGMTKLTTEISSGNLPDIIDLNGFDVSTLVAQGILVDLLPLMEQQGDRSADAILPNVLQALTVDGGLYYTLSGFSVNTVLGPTALVGSEPGWNYRQFQEAFAKMPAGATVFDQYYTRDSALYQCLSLELGNYINWEDGTCDFDNDSFIGLLEFVNTFPADFDWENYDYEGYESTGARIANGKQMLCPVNFSDYYGLLEQLTYFNNQATAIGYPTSSGVGSYIEPLGSKLAITTKCKKPEAAWELLSNSFSSRYSWGFPIFAEDYQALREDACTPNYQYDANGNIMYDENGEPLQYAKYGIWTEEVGEIEIYALTEEQADWIDSVVLSAERIDNNNEAVAQIVSEEAAAFFSGDKSAAEVAALVQSRASYYVAEQK